MRTTTGLESAVHDDPDTEPVGHVLMLDYDSTDKRTVYDDIQAVPGPVVIHRTQPDSWHLYGLQIRPLSDQLDLAVDTEADAAFVQEMDRRGMMTLRIGAKPDRARPFPVVADLPDPEDGSVPVSRPHIDQLRQFADDRGNPTVWAKLGRLQAGLSDYEPTGEYCGRTEYRVGPAFDYGGGRSW